MERRTNENEETREFDHTDFYQMYQDEMDCIVPARPRRWRSCRRSF